MNDNSTLYQCPVCGLHYKEEETAKDCEAFCSQHNACSLEIIQHSIETLGNAES
jgi:hypothetical protein